MRSLLSSQLRRSLATIQPCQCDKLMPWLAPLRAASTKDASGAAVVAVDRAQRLSGRDAASPTEKAARYL